MAGKAAKKWVKSSVEPRMAELQEVWIVLYLQLLESYPIFLDSSAQLEAEISLCYIKIAGCSTDIDTFKTCIIGENFLQRLGFMYFEIKFCFILVQVAKKMSFKVLYSYSFFFLQMLSEVDANS